MSQKSENRSLKWVDIALIILALLLLMGSLLMLSNEKYFNMVWGGGSSGAQIAQLLSRKNDVRYRNYESFAWVDSEETQKILLGDSIFTGPASTSEILLHSGLKINSLENSLIVFRSFNELSLPDFTFGRFRLSVNGKIQFTINGEYIELDGNGEVELVLEEGKKPYARVISGSASLKVRGSNLQLGNQYAYLDLPYVYDVLADNQLGKRNQRILAETDSRFAHISKLCEIYTCEEPSLKRRMLPVQEVQAPVELRWSNQNKQTTFMQISPNPKFSGSSVVEVPSFLNSYRPSTSQLGINFYRFSPDGSKWGDTLSYEVEARSLDLQAPRLQPEKRTVYLREDQGILRYHIEHDYFVTPEEAIAQSDTKFLTEALIEVIYTNQTSQDLVYVKRSLTKSDSLKFTSPGSYLLRIRGLNTAEQLTDLSEPIQITVRKTRQVPVFLAKKKATNPKVTKVEKAMRKPTQVENTIKQVIERITGKRNVAYTKSRFSVEGSAFTMFSTDQSENNTEAPLALLLGIKIQHWMERVGLIGLFRSKVVDMTAGSPVSPTQVEARVAYRWPMSWGMLKNSNSQFSLFGGYEMYRNGSSDLAFSRGYDLMKLGFGLDFPAYDNWDTGGEVLYGLGPDGSTKYEVSGFFTYYLQKDVSFGAGYRVHLFEAGSTKTAPGLMPYREGYGEGYSALRWHY